MGVIFLENRLDPNSNTAKRLKRSTHEWAMTIASAKAFLEKETLEGRLMIKEPVATATLTKKQLENIGFVGIYKIE